MHKGNGNAPKFSLSLRNLHLSRVKLGEDTALSALTLPGALNSHSSKGKKHQRSQQGFSVELVGGRSLLSRALSHAQLRVPPSAKNRDNPRSSSTWALCADPPGEWRWQRKLPKKIKKKIKGLCDSQGCSWSKVCSYRNCWELHKEQQLPCRAMQLKGSSCSKMQSRS